MNENKLTQPVEGAGALSEIFKMLFKGLDNIFDAAAEYQNDMGVLKQVNKVPVKDAKGNDYTIEIKLAPVKDRDGIFYVEIDSNYPEFDDQGLNKQLLTINKKNTDQFEEWVVTNILKPNKLSLSSSQSQKGKGSQYTIPCYDENKFTDWSESGFQGPEPRIIDVNVKESASTEERGKIDLDVTCSDRKLQFDDHELVEDNVTNLSPNEVEGVIENILKSSKLVSVEDVEDMIETNEENVDSQETQTENISDVEEEIGTPATSYVDVSLSYIKSSEEVRMTAIYANYNVSDAMRAVEQVVDNDDFIAILTEEPQSFRITDEGDDFDVSEIDEVNIDNMNDDIFNAITTLDDMLQTYYVNMDTQQQAAAMEISSILQKARVTFKSDDITDEL